jgi:hypothetical protein
MSTNKQAAHTDPEFFPENVECIETVHNLFYLIRTGDLDWLEEVVKSSGGIVGRKCVMSIPRSGSTREAAGRLLDAHVRSRVNNECPTAPYRSGMLLTGGELESIVKTIADDLNRNIRLAEEEQRKHEAPIIGLAKELGLEPRPAGQNESDWMANCPRGSHWIMISPSHNEFGCGYCRRKGGPEELQAFCNSVRSRDWHHNQEGERS